MIYLLSIQLSNIIVFVVSRVKARPRLTFWPHYETVAEQHHHAVVRVQKEARLGHRLEGNGAGDAAQAPDQPEVLQLARFKVSAGFWRQLTGFLLDAHG